MSVAIFAGIRERIPCLISMQNHSAASRLYLKHSRLRGAAHHDQALAGFVKHGLTSTQQPSCAPNQSHLTLPNRKALAQCHVPKNTDIRWYFQQPIGQVYRHQKNFQAFFEQFLFVVAKHAP